MKLHTLKPAKGATKGRKRIARGQGSGKGGTATRGHKGQKSRSGFKRKRGHEGGQMPLQMRVPKRGFNNVNRVEYVPLNLDRLQQIIDKHKVEVIDITTLLSLKIVRPNDRVKILGNGELHLKLDIKAHAFSKSAKQAIEALGGTVEVVK